MEINHATRRAGASRLLRPARYRRLSTELLLFARLLPVAAAALYWLERVPLAELVAMARRGSFGPWRIPAELGELDLDLRRLHRLVDTVSRLVQGHRRCLVRSVLLYGLLARRGLSPELVLGVCKPSAQGFLSHAWVVLDGEPLYESTRLESFRPIARFDDRGQCVGSPPPGPRLTSGRVGG